jgi:hypothetical protein
MHPHAFVREQGITDAKHERFHGFNLAALRSNNNQVVCSNI